jgi:hypothetical protein
MNVGEVLRNVECRMLGMKVVVGMEVVGGLWIVYVCLSVWLVVVRLCCE